MSNTIQNQYMPDYVSPPGETLLESIEAIGMSQADLAERTGRPKKTINEIIKGKAAITQETALQLERVLGIPASFWNNREHKYREALARIEEKERLQRDVEWLKEIQVKALIKAGWIRAFNDKVPQVQEALNYFGVASPERWREIWLGAQVSYRKSPAFQSDPGAVAAWLRKGELDARQIDCAPYDESKFKETLHAIRSLTDITPDVFQVEIVRLCAKSGVAVVFTPELPKTRISGATRWLNANKALIQLSLRYKTDDHLWFTFFHETGHILLHGKKDVFIESDGDTDTKEVEANRFAANFLIPPAEFKRISMSANISKKAIVSFAKEIGISPGVVVGRLQHEGILKCSYCNELKQSFEWKNK